MKGKKKKAPGSRNLHRDQSEYKIRITQKRKKVKERREAIGSSLVVLSWILMIGRWDDPAAQITAWVIACTMALIGAFLAVWGT